MKRGLAWSLALLLTLMLGGVATVGWTAWRSLTEPFQAYEGRSLDLVI